MNKLDKDRNVTQEYLDYVSSLDRKDLETFYIGADLLVNRLNNNINELEKELEDMATLKTDKYGNTRKITHVDINWLLTKIKELKGVDKE